MLILLLISIALSMDSFSVAICAGAGLSSPGFKKPAIVGLYFGLFHFAMVAMGWLGGDWISSRIGGVDHWIAFIILAIIGGRMILSFWQAEKISGFSFKPAKLAMLALATSVDAFGAGASLAVIDGHIFLAAATVSAIVFGFSFFGVWAGRSLHRFIGDYSQLAGGALLILIGLKILIDHGNFF